MGRLAALSPLAASSGVAAMPAAGKDGAGAEKGSALHHPPASPANLPALREDLEIVPGPGLRNGLRCWLVHDRFRDRHFQVDRKFVELAAIWQPVAPGQMVAIASRRLGRPVSGDEISEMAAFLLRNSLALQGGKAETTRCMRQDAAARRSLLARAFQAVFFLRLRLIRPQRFLDLAWPVVRHLFTKRAVVLYFLAAMAGLYLLSRQWDQFVASLAGMMTPSGMVAGLWALVLVKLLHEAGHAFMARKHGVSVPSAGIAFMLGMPVLYTDTGAAWRLDRRRRMMIAAAGIFAELVLAALATLFWVFLPDGPLRQAAFNTAAISWIMSLAVNLNPFMRFDGYYLFADWIGIENLQERGFGLARWRLRELLFALRIEPPEHLPVGLRRIVILHAFATWLYRVVLFLTIALLVYGFFIKVAGIAMFLAGIGYFIAGPLWREIRVWWELRESIAATRRTRAVALLSIAIVALLVLPWSGRVEVPAMLRHDGITGIYAPVSARVVHMNLADGRMVRKGESLLALSATDLDHRLEIASRRAELLEMRLRRVAADPLERSMMPVLQRELATAREALEGFRRLRESLDLRAPFDGVLENAAPELYPGMHVSPARRLALLRGKDTLILRGYVHESGYARLSGGETGRFLPDDPQFPTLPVRLATLGETAMGKIALPLLTQRHGGAIPLEMNPGSEQPVPAGAWFAVTLLPGMDLSPQSPYRTLDRELRGMVILDGERRSLASAALSRVAGILVRESGF